MNSPRIMEFPKRTRRSENSTGGRANLIGRTAFIAVLVGLAFVDFEIGSETISREEDYTSDNTKRLNIEEMCKLLLDLDFIKQAI